MRRARHLRRTPTPARLGLALGTLALLGAACSGGERAGTEPGGRTATETGSPGDGMARLRLVSALQPFSACDDLLDHLHREATERVTAYGLPGPGGAGTPLLTTDAAAREATPTPATTAAGMADPGASTGGAAAEGPANDVHSSTNTVEAGIDEGDTVKTDGTHLYLLSNGALRVVRADPAAPAVVGRLELPGSANQLVRVGNTLLVTGWPQQADPPAGAASEASVPTGWDQQTALWQVDVSEPSAPRIVRQLVVDGSVLSIRLTGDVARVVVQTPPPGLDFVTANGPGAEDRAKRTNEQVIAESTIEDWLPGYRLLDGSGAELNAGRLAECDEVARPKDFHGFTTTTVVSVDLTDGLSEPAGSAVLADGQRVYASAGNLYVAIGEWEQPWIGPADTTEGGDGGDTATTDIHRFTFVADRASYTATGSVEGSLMNDFSMSERDGVLRVATTAGTSWNTTEQSESFVTTLRAEGPELVQAGRVGELGRGEQIRAVRFIGTNGYVVTFRQTDPLYVIDLRDPAAPAVTGELKINGYSAYLHELRDGRLLGVGQDATDEGRVTGGQVSVFDVSDPAAPTRTATYAIPNGTFSAEWDYKAFLYWAPEDLVLLPASSYAEHGETFTGVVGLDIGETITERGRLAATPVADSCPQPVPMPMPVEDGAATQPGAPEARETQAGATEARETRAGATEPAAPATTIAGGAVMPCMPWSMPFERTVVIGSSVFALSGDSLQTADLATLSAQGRVGLA